MNLLGFAPVTEFASSIIDRFFPKKMSQEEKAKVQIELEALLQQRESAITKAKENIMVAELNQGDTWTKRARPSVIYFGLIFIGINYVLYPIIGNIYLLIKGSEMVLPTLTLPTQFWYAWASVASVWELGRSWEKTSGRNKMVDLITGSGGN